MALLGSRFTSELGLRLLLCPAGSNMVMRTACCSVGIVLPVYSTFKAIERKDEDNQQKWLIYWAAYGSFSLAEVFSDKLMYWLPYYYHLKFAFLVWLQLPSANGARQLYRSHLRPFLLRHQAKIDQFLGFTDVEMSKYVIASQAEIQALLLKIMKLVDQLMRGSTKPDHPEDKSEGEGEG